jgi:tetratricopeptide (TPR) repeat protein
MEELLVYLLSRVADETVPGVRSAWGNWGCFMAAVLAVAILVWFLPAYLFHRQGEDWRAWLIVGPLATLLIVVMITVTFGLAAGSRGESNEQAVTDRPASQTLGNLVIREMPQHTGQVVQDRQSESGTSSIQAHQHLDLAYDHEDRGEFTDALRQCETAVRYDPGYAEAHNLRGIVLEELELKEEAIAAYGEAVRLAPAFDEARKNLSEAEAEQGAGTVRAHGPCAEHTAR